MINFKSVLPLTLIRVSKVLHDTQRILFAQVQWPLISTQVETFWKVCWQPKWRYSTACCWFCPTPLPTCFGSIIAVRRYHRSCWPNYWQVWGSLQGTWYDAGGLAFCGKLWVFRSVSFRIKWQQSVLNIFTFPMTSLSLPLVYRLRSTVYVELLHLQWRSYIM